MPASLVATIDSSLKPSGNPYLAGNQSAELDFGPDRFGSEAPFAPRIGATAEDDGHLISFVADLNSDTSECWLIDAQDIAAGPVCRIRLPERICAGTRTTWADARDIGIPANPLLV